MMPFAWNGMSLQADVALVLTFGQCMTENAKLTLELQLAMVSFTISSTIHMK